MNRNIPALVLCAMLVVRSAHAQSITIPIAPVLSIGDANSDSVYSFNHISHVRRLSDGRTVVAMDADIRFYDRNGKYLGKAGGRGRGPGEFQFIMDLAVLPGDTLLVLDIRERVWLSPQGKYVRMEKIDFGPLTVDGWFSEGALLVPNGGLLASQYRSSAGNDPQLNRPVLRYTLFHPATATVHPLITSGGLRQMSAGGGVVQPFILGTSSGRWRGTAVGFCATEESITHELDGLRSNRQTHCQRRDTPAIRTEGNRSRLHSWRMAQRRRCGVCQDVQYQSTVNC